MLIGTGQYNSFNITFTIYSKIPLFFAIHSLRFMNNKPYGGYGQPYRGVYYQRPSYGPAYGPAYREGYSTYYGGTGY